MTEIAKDKIVDLQKDREMIESQQVSRLTLFDPNTATESDWVEMGLTRRNARTIRNYIEKGGRFRSPAELGKILGMLPADVKRLMPYVRIAQDVIRTRPPTNWESEQTNVFLGRRSKGTLMLDINQADSTAWESLPGIGPGYARRIVRYRERLGGFVRVEQIAETYQLPDSVYRRILPLLNPQPTSPVRTININDVSIDTLGRHPYGGFAMARLVIRYREQHGSFRSLEDLLNIQRVDSSWWLRIHPYLRLQ